MCFVNPNNVWKKWFIYQRKSFRNSMYKMYCRRFKNTVYKKMYLKVFKNLVWKKLLFLLLKLKFSPWKLNALQAAGLKLPAKKCTNKKPFNITLENRWRHYFQILEFFLWDLCLIFQLKLFIFEVFSWNCFQFVGF